MQKFILLSLIILSLSANSQSFKITCPLVNAKEVFEKQAISYGKELKIILTSDADTTVNAGVDGIVTNVQRDDDGKMLVVFTYKKFYLWFSGISKATVVEKQKIKAGDIIGLTQPGDKITLRIFDFETPVDPKLYLDCKLSL